MVDRPGELSQGYPTVTPTRAVVSWKITRESRFSSMGLKPHETLSRRAYEPEVTRGDPTGASWTRFHTRVLELPWSPFPVLFPSALR